MNALEVMKLGKKLGKDVRMTMLDLPIERQQQLAERDGYGDNLTAWQELQAQKIKKSDEWSKQNPIRTFNSIEEAEAAGFVVPRWQKSGETLVATFHKTLD